MVFAIFLARKFKERLYDYCHILAMNHIIPIDNIRTIFGHLPTSSNFWSEISDFSDIGRTRTDFLLKLAQLDHTSCAFFANLSNQATGAK